MSSTRPRVGIDHRTVVPASPTNDETEADAEATTRSGPGVDTDDA